MFQHVQIRYQEQIRVGVGVVHQTTIKKSLDRIIIEIIQSVTIILNLISVLIPDGKIQIRIRIVASDQEEILMKILECLRLREQQQLGHRPQQQHRQQLLKGLRQQLEEKLSNQ